MKSLNIKPLKILSLVLLTLVCTILPMFVEKTIVNPDIPAFIPIRIIPMFVFGLIIALLLFLLNAINPKILDSASLIYSLPAFIVMFFISYKSDRISPFSDSYPLAIKNFSAEKLSPLRPIFGYISEFLLGFTIMLIILAIIKNRKNLKEFFAFKKSNLVMIILPILLGYIETWTTIMHYNYEEKLINMMSDTNATIPFFAQVFPQSIRIALPFFIITFICMFFLLKKIDIKPIISIILIVVGLIFIARGYLGLTSNSAQTVVFIGKSGVMISGIVTPILIMLGIKSLKKS